MQILDLASTSSLLFSSLLVNSSSSLNMMGEEAKRTSFFSLIGGTGLALPGRRLLAPSRGGSTQGAKGCIKRFFVGVGACTAGALLEQLLPGRLPSSSVVNSSSPACRFACRRLFMRGERISVKSRTPLSLNELKTKCYSKEWTINQPKVNLPRNSGGRVSEGFLVLIHRIEQFIRQMCVLLLINSFLTRG